MTNSNPQAGSMPTTAERPNSMSFQLLNLKRMQPPPGAKNVPDKNDSRLLAEDQIRQTTQKPESEDNDEERLQTMRNLITRDNQELPANVGMPRVHEGLPRAHSAVVMPLNDPTL